MSSKSNLEIVIKGAKTNNLKNLSLRIPHNKFVVVTGISGSGKSSLVFEIIAKEGQRRYFETLPSFARQFLGKLNRPEVDEIEGLSPVIAIGQRTTGIQARSTVGTMTDIYDLLRLLYARTGKTNRDINLTRSLFSFNSEIGKCKRCNGIGKEEQIDLAKLIAFPDRTIRQGALAPTLPTGYIMYSQVTIDVLNQVCQAEGFDVDIPWCELSDAQQEVILYGSDKIKVPFGKHSLESRLKWTGIKAKPREEGHYKGMIPIMSDILRRDRNANILKYVHAITCEDCQGTRLNNNALSVTIHEKTIADLCDLDLIQLKEWISAFTWNQVEKEIITKIESQIALLEDLGLGHLMMNRPSKSLRASEIQRIRVANQLTVPLSGVLYVFDEPSIGLHHTENARLIHHFKHLVEKGNTVIVVEHDLDTIRSADHIIEVGPGAGVEGGTVLYNGPLFEFSQREELQDISPTYRAIIQSGDTKNPPSQQSELDNSISLIGCHERNLKGVDVRFQLGKLNIVSGKSGAGKSSLIKGTLIPSINHQLGILEQVPKNLAECKNSESINKLIFIDHSPIGRTPRSNPANYLGISDHIRDVFAKLPYSKTHSYTKSRFSFNNKGGRCETCQGAGKTQIGMHFLGNVELVCGACNGRRFNKETLKATYKGKSIADVYTLSIHEAILFFEGEKKVLKGLQILQELGLGYLTLGQSSTTLSGGEGQRIKIANQLQKSDTGDTLYVIIEPSIGLHQDDIGSLVQLFDRIKKKGNTIVCIEQNQKVISKADWHIELGPQGGASGGEIVYQGVPIVKNHKPIPAVNKEHKPDVAQGAITLNGVTTNGLKNVDVVIPKNQLTVVTGLSGSGKSSLVYDTLFAEANARFTESLSTYNRSFLKQNNAAEIQSYAGLGPAIKLNRKGGSPSKRSTVGTLSGIYDSFRLLYSRIAQHQGKEYTAQHFSFNHHLGACPNCNGLGVRKQCNPEEIIISHEKSVYEGAIYMDRTIDYADINGQYMATLRAVAKDRDRNLDRPWKELEEDVVNEILYGTGDTEWDVTWEYKTKSRSGTQKLKVRWLGFCTYINEEYKRKRHNKNIDKLEKLLHDVVCTSCEGSRLKPELLDIHFLGRHIHELSGLSIASCLELLHTAVGEMKHTEDATVMSICEVVLPTILESLESIDNLGLGYLDLDRPIHTLSGGERQRVMLAGQLSSHLFGVTYTLDEPTIGLDEAQIHVLLATLRKIVDNGNTVVVVEHDPTFIKNSDYLIEIGPGAGRQGGEVIYQGGIEGIKKIKHSVTHQMLYGNRKSIKNWKSAFGTAYGIKGAYANNLKHIDVNFYGGQITAVRGVSGSGKSSLIKEVLYQSWLKKRSVHCASVFGLDQFDEVILIDQEMAAQSRLSTPISITGILDKVKKIYGKTEFAKREGLKNADFSYLSKKGKCPTCSGQGKVKTSMDFMSDIWLSCDACSGRRYSESILACLYKGHSIGDVLSMTVSEAIDLMEEDEVIDDLNVLSSLGLGHLLLGQAGNTLSGGESQRLKLATSLLKKRQGSRLYLIDEPSTGLHYLDIMQLVSVFQSLVEIGDTILFIEHNGTLIDYADHVITLGPGSGEAGGELVGSEKK